METFKAAIFDLDMTIINTITGLTVSSNMVARQFGLPEKTQADLDHAERAAVVNNLEGVWRALWGDYDPRWYEHYCEKKLALAEFEAMELFPEARPALEALYKLGVPMGMASNRDDPAPLLEILGLRHYFKAVVGEHDVPRPKPAPDMVFKVVEGLGAAPEDILYIGDSRGDLKAAGEVGIKVFAVTTGGHSAEELTALGAWKTGDSLAGIERFFT